MNGSRTIRVRKRDGAEEPIDHYKLTGAIWRAMQSTAGTFRDAGYLADAIRIHLERIDRYSVTSDELFEMVLKILRKVRMNWAAEALTVHRICRTAHRQCLIIIHGEESASLWDKSWLAGHVEQSWGLGRRAARIVAGYVESELLEARETLILRETVIERMNACVASLGLAGAVPVSSTPART